MAITFKQSNTYYCTFNLVDRFGDPIVYSSLSTVQLSVYYLNTRLSTSDRFHGQYINSRESQNIKNTNNVTISTNGTLSWYIQPADTAMLDEDAKRELHVARFEWYYGLPDGSRGRNSLETFFFIEANAGNI